MNKELALLMVDELERLFTENLALRQYVDRLHDIRETERTTRPTLLPAPTAHQLTEGKKRTEETPSLASQMFGPLRAEIEEETDLSPAVSELLRLVQTRKDVN